MFYTMKENSHYLYRFLLLTGWLFVYSVCSSQISFLEDFPMEFELREIEGVVELDNGNFCMILREDDMSQETSRIQSVYLFDQCGKYIDRIQFLNIDEYIDFYNVTIFQDKILMLGYFNAGDYLMMLDPDDLSIVKEKYHFGWDYKDQVVNEELNRVGHLGVGGDLMNYSTYDEELEREIDIGIEITEENLRWIQYSHATDKYIFYDKEFDDIDYSEIGIADYNLDEIGTIEGSSVHGNIRFGKKIFVNDSTFYTTVSYQLDEGLYYRKYILDFMIYETAIDPLSQIGQGFQYEVLGDQVNVIHNDKSFTVYDIETANLISKRQILPDSISNLSWMTALVKTKDGGKLFADSHWTYIDNVWQSYIRLMKLNSNLELDLTPTSPCIVSNEEVFVNDFDVRIGSNPSLGSFSIISNAKLSSIDLFDARGSIVKATILPNTTYGYQVSTDYKGLVVVVVKRNDGVQLSRKVMIY
ncbi:MAG: hypothetical protein ACJA1A_000724 [Saprospiraceae bacterium]|jgi:hypothetical protein